MRTRVLSGVAAVAALCACDSTASEAQTIAVKEWPVEWQGRPRDPSVDAQGRVWFVGQVGNYIGMFDPKSERFQRFELEEGTYPHNLIVAREGGVWYSGNHNARIGRLDPATGAARTYPMPDPAAGDPHTLVFDGRGSIWFTVQQGGFIGRLHLQSGKIELLNTGKATYPYGIAIDSRGRAWVNLFATNRIAVIDPGTFTKRELTVPRANARTRRIAVTSDDAVWYVDYAGGMLGRIDPRTQAIKEWPVPGGADGRPYALVADDQDRLWFALTGASPSLVGFDPQTGKFFAQAPVSGGIRNMAYHRPTRALWFGTDANHIGRAILP